MQAQKIQTNHNYQEISAECLVLNDGQRNLQAFLLSIYDYETQLFN